MAVTAEISGVSEQKNGLEDRLSTTSSYSKSFIPLSELNKTTKNYKIEEESKFYRWACNCIWAGCVAGPVFTMANVFILNKYFHQGDNFGYGQDVIPFVLGSFLEGAVISGTAYNICRHNKKVQLKVSHAYQQAKKAAKFAFREGISNAKIIKKSVEKTLASAYNYFL